MLISYTNRDKIRILKYCIQKTSDGRNPLASVLLREHYSVAKQDGEKEEDTPVSWGILNGTCPWYRVVDFSTNLQIYTRSKCTWEI